MSIESGCRRESLAPGVSQEPALFTYHNVQKKSCLIGKEQEEEEQEEEQEDKEEEEEEEEEELEDQEMEQEQEREEQVPYGAFEPSNVPALQAEARRRFSGETLLVVFIQLSWTSVHYI